ncbi:MAG: hypothetical protein ABF289_02600 [Clostridiales bacterium]
MDLDLMTANDFENLLKSESGHYYIGRWEYFKEVLKILENYKNEIKMVLELGPSLMPIVKNSDLVINPREDQFGTPTELNVKKYSFDATTKPWPIKNKQYDMFIALQVWEHLDNKQSRVFREVIRISKMAILSFPYKWNDQGDEKLLEKPGYRAHFDIDKELISDWTLGIKPKKIIEIPRTGTKISKGPRIIYFWKF